MSTLDDIFPDAKERRAARTEFDDRHTLHRLDELFGERRANLDVTHRASARPRLVAMVESAAADARSVTAAPPAQRGPKNPVRRRIDLVSVSAAALAVVALVAAGVVGGLQAATASPASESLGILAADEKTITSVEGRLVETREQITDDITQADAQAAALRSALESVREATDPADIPPGWTEAPDDAGTIAVADGAALTAALGAVDEYRTDLAAIELPMLPPSYERVPFDEGSLPSVASAIDGAQAQLAALDGATSSLRAVRADLQARTDVFAVQLKAFTATFVPAAEQAIADHPDARQSYQQALTAAAAAVAAADLLTAEGEPSLQQYRTALVDLVADQVYQDRVREERIRDQREQEQREREQRQRDEQREDPEDPPQNPENPENPENPQDPENPQEPENPQDPPTTLPPTEPEG